MQAAAKQELLRRARQLFPRPAHLAEERLGAAAAQCAAAAEKPLEAVRFIQFVGLVCLQL